MKLALMVGTPEMVSEGGYVETPTGPFRDTIQRAARLGFDGVEVLAAKRQDGDLRGLREALANTGLKVAGINSGRLLFDYGLVLLCGSSRQCSLTRSAMYDLIRFAAPFSAHINIGMFRGMPSNQNHTVAVERLIGILRQLADYARQLGVELLIEPQNKEEFPFISSTAEGVALVERIGHPNVGLMLDTFHMAIEKEDMVVSIERAMPYLRHIHFLDLDRNPPLRTSTGIDLPGIFRALARHNYRHYLSMPLVRERGDEATAEAVRYLRSLMAAADSN